MTSGFEGPVAPAIGTRRDTTLRWNAVSELFAAATLLRLPDLLHIPTWRGSKETAVFAAEL